MSTQARIGEPSFAVETDLDAATAKDGERPTMRRIGQLLDDALARAERRRRGDEKPIPLPWPSMRTQFGGGLWPGVHVLVSATGSGKSTWALQLGLASASAGLPVAYIGLELDEMQIALRLLAEAGRVPWSPLYLGTATVEQIRCARDAKATIEALPLYVELGRPGGWPVSELAALVEQMRAAHPEPAGAGSLPMLVVLDFLQIVGDERDGEGRPARLDLRERIGRAAYFARDVTRRFDVAVLLISSAARDKYGALGGETLKDVGLAIDCDKDAQGKVRWEDGVPVVRSRRVLRPDLLVGLGKESGEIEFAADSVTAAIRSPLRADKNESSSVLFITAKGRATGAAWTELRFNGHRFADAPDLGLKLAMDLDSKREGPLRKTNGSNGRTGHDWE